MAISEIIIRAYVYGDIYLDARVHERNTFSIDLNNRIIFRYSLSKERASFRARCHVWRVRDRDRVRSTPVSYLVFTSFRLFLLLSSTSTSSFPSFSSFFLLFLLLLLHLHLLLLLLLFVVATS